MIQISNSSADNSSAALEEKIFLNKLAQGDRAAFWQLWLQHQDYLYHRCRTWMGGNHGDAEEALSRARLKAWEKLPNYAEKITNQKAWLTRMSHNLCVDIHRERQREARSIESMGTMAVEDPVVSNFESPESAILRRELGIYIRRGIEALPTRLRAPFILRFYQELSYPDIARQLALSTDNVYKRIQQAREMLQKRLNKYFFGLSGSEVESPQSDEPTTADWEAPITVECTVDQINYRITATCLETLPHAWYSSPSPLGWS